MNAAESARIVAAKFGTCIACLILMERGVIDYPDNADDSGSGGDYHHLLSGGRRRGHRFGLLLCPYHHRGVPYWGCTAPEMRATFGPSLMDGSKTFHDYFGTDAELLERQDALIGATQ